MRLTAPRRDAVTAARSLLLLAGLLAAAAVLPGTGAAGQAGGAGALSDRTTAAIDRTDGPWSATGRGSGPDGAAGGPGGSGGPGRPGTTAGPGGKGGLGGAGGAGVSGSAGGQAGAGASTPPSGDVETAGAARSGSRSGAGTAGTAGTAANLPTATPFDGVPAVGPLFLDGNLSGQSCTGTVVRAGGADLVLTAAHCISGNGHGVRFAPGYRAGTARYGVWSVAAVYTDPRWLADQDPQHDAAVLALAAQTSGGAPVRLHELVTGYRVGAATDPGARITVIAYPTGADRPVRCTTADYRFAGYPAFDCHGFTLGTSGSPFLTVPGTDFPDALEDGAPVVRGLIGGLHQGGCLESTSYSPLFGDGLAALVERARRGGAADVLPVPGGDGC